MVALIGLATMVALVWLLAFSMTTESEAERRRLSTPTATPEAGPERILGSGTKHAA